MLNNSQPRSPYHRHRSTRSSRATTSTPYSPQTIVPAPVPLTSLVQCSAYFIYRLGLSNYAEYTLKQTIDRIITGPKSKGLKVKLSLPDEGLVIDNIPDPNQSWMYKTSELLYFWRDPYYLDVIVIVTANRKSRRSSEPYSISIFRLRGNESVQLFLHRAQEYFARLSAENIPNNYTKRSVTKSATEGDLPPQHSKKHSKPRSTTKERSVSRPSQSPHARTEFDPENQRTFSETTMSSDTHTTHYKPNPSSTVSYDEDDRTTTISGQLPFEYAAELMRELKELRTEIAALKLGGRFTPVRSSSASPLSALTEETVQRMNPSPSFPNSKSQSDVDAETQTDFSCVTPNGSDENLVTNTRKNKEFNNRTLSNASESSGLYRGVEFSPMNISSTGTDTSSAIRKDYPSTVLPVSNIYQHSFHHSNGTRENSMNTPSSNLSVPKTTGDVVSFRTSLEDTTDLPDRIYENVSTGNPTDPSQNYYQVGRPYVQPSISGNAHPEVQQQYFSLVPQQQQQQPKTNHSSSLAPPEFPVNRQSYPQQVMFANHLTNPLFNVDRQLLANTIANQFGVDPNSPQLQQLVANQHLFVTHKRTFANMVWQITSEEEKVLCSSPLTSKLNSIDLHTLDSNSSPAKPILKPTNASRSIPKRQRISWDRTLE